MVRRGQRPNEGHGHEDFGRLSDRSAFASLLRPQPSTCTRGPPPPQHIDLDRPLPGRVVVRRDETRAVGRPLTRGSGRQATADRICARRRPPHAASRRRKHAPPRSSSPALKGEGVGVDASRCVGVPGVATPSTPCPCRLRAEPLALPNDKGDSPLVVGVDAGPIGSRATPAPAGRP